MSLGQFLPTILGCSLTAAGKPALHAGSSTSPGGPVLYMPTSLVTGTDDGLDCWLAIPPYVATDETFATTARRPTSLRIFRTGQGNPTGLVLPTYRLGIIAPALYTPNVAPNGATGSYGSWGTLTPQITWISALVADSGTYIASTEQVLPLANASLPSATYQRGQVVLHVTLPTSTAGAGLQIWGCGFRG